MHLDELVLRWAEADPDRVALHTTDGPCTFGDLAARTGRTAAALHDAGVRRGESVLVVADASPLLVSTVLGAYRVGAAAAPVLPRLTGEEIADLGRAIDARVAVVDAPFVHHASGVTPVVLSPADVAAARSTAAHDDRDDDLPALVLFTSGTTGRPKPISISGRALTARVAAFGGPFLRDAPPGVSLTCVPGAHVGGLVGLFTGLTGGTTSVLQTRFDAGEWLELVERHRVQRTFLVPAMLHRILDHPAFATADLSSLVMVTYGAAAAPAALVERAVRALPHVLFSNTYGQTETIGAIAALGPDDHRPDEHGRLPKLGSVGRPFPGIEVELRDPESGERVPAGEPGELWVRSAGLTPAGDGWHRTGDIVSIDADGYLWPAGRLADTVNRGGEKFGTAEVEDVLRAHPSVADAAIAPVPDDVLGERAGAVIVTSPDAQADPAELAAWCTERLARFKVPDPILVVDEIPLTHYGKVDKRAVSNLLMKT